MDQTSASPKKGKSFDPAKIRFKYARRWFVIGVLLAVGLDYVLERVETPWWQSLLAGYGVLAVATWIIRKDTR